jgi:hypothetical protein
MGSDMAYFSELEREREAAEATEAACELARILKREQPQIFAQIKPLLSRKTLKWLNEREAEERKQAENRRKEAKRRKLANHAKSKLSKAEREALGL